MSAGFVPVDGTVCSTCGRGQFHAEACAAAALTKHQRHLIELMNDQFENTQAELVHELNLLSSAAVREAECVKDGLLLNSEVHFGTRAATIVRLSTEYRQQAVALKRIRSAFGLK